MPVRPEAVADPVTATGAAAALAGCATMPAPALAERVEELTVDWLGGRGHDDIAVLAVRAEAPRPVGGPGRHLRSVRHAGTGERP